jgi:hypothetical protein
VFLVSIRPVRRRPLWFRSWCSSPDWARSPSRSARGRWAGASAAVTALAVHSGFDFLWHPAVLPLLGGLLCGLAAPAAVPGATTGGNPVPAGPVEAQPPLVKESAI